MKFRPVRMCALAALILLIIYAWPTIAGYLGKWNRQLDRMKPVEVLLSEAQDRVTRDQRSLAECEAELSQLERKRAKLVQQRADCARGANTHRELLAVLRDRVDRYGQSTSHQASSGADDAAYELEVCFERCKAADAELKHYDEAIAMTSAAIGQIRSAIVQAKRSIAVDEELLAQAKIDNATHRVKSRISELIDKATPEAILAEERLIDRKLAAAQVSMAASSGNSASLDSSLDQSMSAREVATRVDEYLAQPRAQ